MRRRIIGLLVAALAVAGFVIAAPQQAQAYPITGTHTADLKCKNGVAPDLYVTLTWQTTFVIDSEMSSCCATWPTVRPSTISSST